MINIAFIIDTIESPTAGTEKQLLLLLKHLDRSRFRPYLCVLRSSGWLIEEFNLCQLYLAEIKSFKSIRSIKGIYNLSRFLQKEKIVIVQTHFRDSSLAGILAARLAGVNIIIGTRRNQGYWLTPLDQKIQRCLDRWVTLYLVNSKSTKNWVSNSEGVDDKRIEVIFNGFDLSMFPEDSTATRKRMRTLFGISEHVPVIGIVANLRPVKDHSTFLKAAQIVHYHFPDARFLVIGSGSEFQKLNALSAELGIASFVDFLGARQDIPDVLAVCDVGVLSSLSESFSNAVVEYMAAGLPVVSTDVGGVSEAIIDGVNGYIVPVGGWEEMANRIIELLLSGRSVGMGQKGRMRSVEYFSLKTMIAKTERLYIRSMTGTI